MSESKEVLKFEIPDCFVNAGYGVTFTTDDGEDCFDVINEEALDVSTQDKIGELDRSMPKYRLVVAVFEDEESEDE